MFSLSNKASLLTYSSTFFSILGLLFFFNTGNVDYSFLGMTIALICDMFDGKVARGIKNRTEKEKEFGVQIDSLSDIVAFIVVPAITIYKLGLMKIYQLVILALYVVSGVVRLGYFNTIMSDKDKAIKVYTGLPVPFSIVIFGFVWLLGKMIPAILNNEVMIYTILVPIVGYLHVSNIKINKITNKWFYIGSLILAICFLLLGLFVL